MEAVSDSEAQRYRQWSTSSSDPPLTVDLALAEEGFAAEEPTTISRLFQKAVAKFPNHPALRYKDNTNHWKELAYTEYYLSLIHI